MKDETVFKLAIIGWIICALFALAFWGAVGFVVLHFLLKWW